LVVLAILSLGGGFIELPHTLGHLELFSDFLKPVLPSVTLRDSASTNTEWAIQAITALLSLSGVYLAYYFYVKKPELPDQLKRSVRSFHYIWFTGWGFDALYNTLLVRPFVFLATVNKRDIVDKFYSLLVSSADFLHDVFARTQGGILRWYVMSIVIGAILILTLGILL
jgi:NADH-quinone oxidoreductase subunit L